ncbi:ABC transporter permease [Streptomyces zaomyceticus]|uniref:ABC transporter permease n=1 Tax=Streptomyces zaomyceticus TaxID=68286 RepID=UPI003681B72F
MSLISRSLDGRRRLTAALFVLPALLLLGSLVAYPIVYSVIRSVFDASGQNFAGLDNYQAMFEDPATLKALRNSAIWVAVAPALLTLLGLGLAVLTEKIRWATAFKVLVFMPMAISFLAAGITFRLVYEQDPQRGLLNAATVGVHDLFSDASSYPGARPRGGSPLTVDGAGAYTTERPVSPGESTLLGLIGLRPADLPEGSVQAAPAPTAPDTVAGSVYLDFAPGGGGKPGTIDTKESGLPGVTVELLRDGSTTATTVSGPDGSFAFRSVAPGAYTLRLPQSNFAASYAGISWLGPTLITASVIGAYLWIWTGFALVLIGAGLNAIPKEIFEAARLDGAGSWAVLRRITVPVLAPVLTVVFVTLLINVMKVFDLVYIIAPGPVQEEATVLALQMWLVSFGGGNNQGLGSAIGVVLLLLVVPAMIFNIRRFRRSQS